MALCKINWKKKQIKCRCFYLKLYLKIPRSWFAIRKSLRSSMAVLFSDFGMWQNASVCELFFIYFLEWGFSLSLIRFLDLSRPGFILGQPVNIFLNYLIIRLYKAQIMYQFFRLLLVVLPLQGSFAFATVWSIGGTCDSDSRIIFDTFLRETLAGKSGTSPVPKVVGKWECPFEEKGLVYDYVYEVWFLASTLIEHLYSLSGMKIALGGYFNFT